MKSKHRIITNSRSGVTLIEMLTVVGLMMFLVAIAVPAFNVNNKGSQVRETARSLQAYLTEARAKAILTGRPCGVAFIPYETYNEACLKAQLVETPPVFCGYTDNDMCTVTGTGANVQVQFTSGVEAWVQKGNRIRLGGRGGWYKMTSGNGQSTSASCEAIMGDSCNANYRPWSTNAPSAGSWKTTYMIQAAPIAEAKNYLQAIGMSAPLMFPRGICADLFYSGYDDSSTFGKQARPVYIMFSPTGQVQNYYYNSDAKIPAGKFYILMGTWERTIQAVAPEDGRRNYQDYDNYWVVVDPATGTVNVEQIMNPGSVSASRTTK